MKRCPKCGCTEFQVHQTEDHVIVVNGAGEFVTEKTSYTEVVHEPTDEDIWQCDECGYTAPGANFNEEALSEESIPEFKGQAADILEDLLTEHGAVIPNKERNDAIEEGDDEECFAIIYGSDYDIIGNEVENIANRYLADKTIDMPGSVAAVMTAYNAIVEKAKFEDGKELSFNEIWGLMAKVEELFANWGIK